MANLVGGHRNGTSVKISNDGVKRIDATYMPNFYEVWNETYERVGDSSTFVYISERKEIDNIWEE